ncbi:MAG: TldD/PmbA family protein [Eubacteriales bacterium]|nr:TldD/PmbA family protein [Eubacteriales bacterium]
MKTPYEIASYAMEGLLKGGADDVSVSCYEGLKNELNAEGGEFSLLRTTADKSLNLTCIAKNKKGTVSGNDTTKEGVDTAVHEALLSSNSAAPDTAWEISRVPVEKTYSFGLPYDKEKMFFRAKEFLDTVKKEYPNVTVQQLVLSHDSSQGLYINNHGVRFNESASCYTVAITLVGRDGEKSSSMNYTSGLSYDLDKPIIEFADIGLLLKSAEKQVHTVPFSGKGVYPVVLSPKCFNTFLTYALGAFASGSSLLENTSIWKDSLNKSVASSELSVSIDPFNKAIVAPDMYTSEGYEAKPYSIIENGVLKHFMLSKYYANKLGLERAPSDGDAFIVSPGKQSLEELIGGIEKGLLVGRFSGGMPAVDGEFSGVAKNSFLIENGKVTKAAAETMISGNLAQVLKSIRGLSKETFEGGFISVPYAAVDGITVSS